MAVSLIIPGKLRRGTFISRPNRFTVIADINGGKVRCYLPNPGRMLELLISGARIVLRDAAGNHRKTQYDLIAVYAGETLVSIDARVPNSLIHEALKTQALEAFLQYTTIKPEYTLDHSRIDFLLSNSTEKCLLEVKSCTLVKNGVALFPDAPTSRGRRHLLDLITAKKEGYRACILFLIQRTDAYLFSPNDETDPQFGDTLRTAATEGVEVYAYSAELTAREILLKERINLKLDKPMEPFDNNPAY